ncbi:MAG: Com family DNA-binding transcriptional regulator [Clostridia bacterium]|nr:Com family DNA-binding transcriptional regulator [Clostridia bacterium]
MIEVRCPNCNQLLIRVEQCKGEIKCIRCKKTITIDIDKKDRVSNTTIIGE